MVLVDYNSNTISISALYFGPSSIYNGKLKGFIGVDEIYAKDFTLSLIGASVDLKETIDDRIQFKTQGLTILTGNLMAATNCQSHCQDFLVEIFPIKYDNQPASTIADYISF